MIQKPSRRVSQTSKARIRSVHYKEEETLMPKDIASARHMVRQDADGLPEHHTDLPSGRT